MNTKIRFAGILIVALFFQTLAAQNTDESQVKPYNLPDVLRTESGKDISSTKKWEKVRRPEILKLFEDHVYGQVPQDFDKISFEIKNEDKNAMEGKATLKEVVISVSRNQKTVSINLVLFTPNSIKNPVATFLVINHRGMRTMDVSRENMDDFGRRKK
jgi:hypothetical protein